MQKYSYPRIEEAHRIHPFTSLPVELEQIDLNRACWHEAGHAVVAEWLGFNPTFVRVAEEGGQTILAEGPIPDWVPEEVIDCVERADGSIALMIAALWHAGVAAELLHEGIPWTGVVARHDSTDWINACDVLEALHWPPGAGHGYAQRIALWVLSERWERVAAIAAHLSEHRGWIPGDGVPPIR